MQKSTHAGSMTGRQSAKVTKMALLSTISSFVVLFSLLLMGLVDGQQVQPRLGAAVRKSVAQVCGKNKHCQAMMDLNGEYCCLRGVMPNFETAQDGLWPQECAVVQDFLFDFDFQFRKRRADHLRQFPFLCAAWRELRKPGFPIITSTSLQIPQTQAYMYYHEIATKILPHMPGKNMHWAQFITLALQRGICDAYNHRSSSCPHRPKFTMLNLTLAIRISHVAVGLAGTRCRIIPPGLHNVDIRFGPPRVVTVWRS